MKKLGIVVAIAMIGASFAVASSLAIPWFMDAKVTAVGFPADSGVPICLIYLKNNVLNDPEWPDGMVAEIRYFDEDGNDLGPEYPDNTFIIPPGASVAFRPGAVDPNTEAGGQEGAVAVLIPTRPRPDWSPAGNGSIVISWQGGPTDIQGMVAQTGTGKGGPYSYAHLLPPGN